MTRHPVRKGLVSLATVFAFFVLSAAQPAGAAEIEDGLLLIGNTEANPDLIFPLGASGPTPPCDAGLNDVDEFEIEEWEKEPPRSWEANGGFAGVAMLEGAWTKAVFDFSDLSGSMTPDGMDPDLWHLTGGGTVVVELWDINVPAPPDPEEPCDKKDLICTIEVEVVLVPDSHRHKTGDADWPGDHLLINANSVAPHLQISIFDCDFLIWLALAGKPAWIRDLVISLP